jgi:hypothetical protein
MSKVTNIIETTKPEWLKALDYFLQKDGYKREVFNAHYVTYRRGNFFEKLQTVTIHKSSLTYYCESYDGAKNIAACDEPLKVSTNVDAGIIVAMLHFVGGFDQPPFKGEPFTLCELMPALTGGERQVPIYEPQPAFAL